MRQAAIYGKDGIGESAATRNLTVGLGEVGEKTMIIGGDHTTDSTQLILGGPERKTVLNALRGEGEKIELYVDREIAFLENIIKVHNKIKHIHISLGKLYPITIINDGYFYVFDVSEAGHKYEFKRKVETSVVVSGEILTAFNLDFYDMKPSVVISKNMIENLGNDILVLHEFVHCFQLESGAVEIRNGLSIQAQEMVKNNYSWEINFPFPYNNKYFINKTMELAGDFSNGNYENVEVYRNCMRAYLHKAEYEYMIWQQWKEGFARYVENLIRRELGLRLNGNILAEPFGRVHFYEIGNKYIEMLLEKEKGLNENIVKLFYEMFICK